MNDKLFRTAYVTQKGFDMSALFQYVDDIVFLNTGNKKIRNLISHIEENIEGFDPELDVVIPVGKVVFAFILGTAFSRISKGKSINIGIYDQGEYDFIKLWANKENSHTQV
jgi:hypothetical protein